MAEYKILFDLWKAQPLGKMKFHGGGEYIKSIYKQLLEYCSSCCIIVFYDHSLFIDDWILSSFREKSIKTIDVKNLSDIQKILNNEKPNVFFSGLPYTYGSLIIPSCTSFYGTMHGFRYLELPVDSFEYKYHHNSKDFIKSFIKHVFLSSYLKHLHKLYNSCLENLDTIVCVSNHTKYAIKNFFPNIKKPIECHYTPQKVVYTNEIEHSDINEKFILLISCNRFEKNSYRAIVAINKLFEKKQLSDYKVVTVGKLSNSTKRNIKYKDKFIHFEYVSTAKLEGLYADCDLFLYPTLNEGFGMPPLEAMKYGKTCVVSGICSVPEICGDAVYYINPYDINEIQTRILLASENKIPQKKIKERLNLIKTKQNNDLTALCKLITSTT